MNANSNIRRLTTSNLYDHNEVMNLNVVPSKPPQMTAESFISRRLQTGIPWEILVDEVVEEMLKMVSKSSVKDFSWYFLGASENWMVPTSDNKQSKFWGSADFSGRKIPENSSPEIMLKHAGRCRFAAMARIDSNDLPFFANWMRSTQRGIFILVEQRFDLDRPSDVGDFYSGAFRDLSIPVDWSWIAHHLYGTKFIAGRCSSSEQRVASFDLLFDTTSFDFSS